MDSWIDSKAFQYVAIFLGTGLVAVAIKALGDLGEGRLAGIVAMLPVKILTAWVILGLGLGAAGIKDSVTGMLFGLLAIGGMLVAVRIAVETLKPLPSVVIGVAVWVVLIGTFMIPWGTFRETGP